jgi:hypothetical protein
MLRRLLPLRRDCRRTLDGLADSAERVDKLHVEDPGWLSVPCETPGSWRFSAARARCKDTLSERVDSRLDAWLELNGRSAASDGENGWAVARDWE